jgi:lipoprotein signal peptidase
MQSKAGTSYLWLFAILAVVGLAADQGSKYGIFTWLYADGPRANEPWLGDYVIETDHRPDSPAYPGGTTRRVELVEGVFSLTAMHTNRADDGDGILSALRTVSGPNLPHVNHGALFGHDFRFSPETSNTLFAVVSLLAAAAIVYWSTRPATRADRALCIALGLILAGTLGNFYDRVVFGGVRDFLHWYKFVNWPVFNIADCCLVCGAGLLLVHALFTSEEPVVEKPAEATTAASA